MRTSRPDVLPPQRIRRAMRLSILEGMAFAVTVGLGEVFYLADAIRLSATRLEQGLVVALPLFVGSAGPLVALRALRRMRTRKPLVVGSALGQALTLLALALGDYLGRSTPGSLIACACAAAVFNQASGTAWSSWFGDLVPSRVRGRYFAVRNRGIYFCTCVGVVGGGIGLTVLERGLPADALRAGGSGFALIFAVAALFRLASVALHVATPEPPFAGLSTPVRVVRYLSTERGRTTRRLLLLCSGFYFLVYVASPYFSPYMLESLHFSYLEYTVANVALVVTKVLFLPLWGRLVDQVGGRAVYLLCALCTAIVPVPWLWAKGLGWVVIAQSISGVAWAGFELSLFTLVLERTYRGVRAHVFATQTVLNGTAQLLGTLVGAFCAPLAGDLRWIFAASFAGRFLFTLRLPALLPPATKDPRLGRRDVFLRVIGFRPSGGLVMRPLPASGEPPSAREDATGEEASRGTS